MLSHHSLKCTHPIEHCRQGTWSGVPPLLGVNVPSQAVCNIRHQACSGGSTPSLPARPPSSYSLICPLVGRAAAEPCSQHGRGSRDGALSSCMGLGGSSPLQKWKLHLFQFELLMLLLWAPDFGFKTQKGFFHLFTYIWDIDPCHWLT